MSAFNQSKHYQDMRALLLQQQQLGQQQRGAGEEGVRGRASCFAGFWQLLMRGFRLYWRNPPFLLTRLRVLCILTVLFGLIYFQVCTHARTHAANQPFQPALAAPATVCVMRHVAVLCFLLSHILSVSPSPIPRARLLACLPARSST